MRRICGKKLTFAVVASLLAGTVPAWAADTTNDVTGKTVTIDTDKKVSDSMYGGFSEKGKALQNTLAIKGGSVQLDFSSSEDYYPGLFGGAGQTGASGNRLSVSGNSEISGGYYSYSMWGGYTYGKAMDNIVSVSDQAAITGDSSVCGGFSDNDESSSQNENVTGNLVEFTSSGAQEITGIYGGYTNGTGTVSGNQVSLTNGTLDSVLIVGGESASVTKSNTVAIGGTAAINPTYALIIYGGNSSGVDGKATDNQVSVMEQAAITGASSVSVYGGYASSGDVTNNQVAFSSSGDQEIDEIYGGYTEGTGTVSGNQVSLTNGPFKTKTVKGGKLCFIREGQYSVHRRPCKSRFNRS